ncbi:hypothetical protein FB446DRAFT_705028 [Lentinula raphanica]|nr:hypothetical protein FB446DRAFT_705028 [Lentinula raphanica]
MTAWALHTATKEQIEVIESADFWHQLAVVDEDFKSIAYVTNIYQGNCACPDIVLLAFVGMYLYFKNLPPACANILKGIGQTSISLMIIALILNSYEHLDSFSHDASVNIINVDAMLFGKIMNHLAPNELNPEEMEAWEDGLLGQSQQFMVVRPFYWVPMDVICIADNMVALICGFHLNNGAYVIGLVSLDQKLLIIIIQIVLQQTTTLQPGSSKPSDAPAVYCRFYFLFIVRSVLGVNSITRLVWKSRVFSLLSTSKALYVGQNMFLMPSLLEEAEDK